MLMFNHKALQMGNLTNVKNILKMYFEDICTDIFALQIEGSYF